MATGPWSGSLATLSLSQYESQKRLANDDLVTVIEGLSISGKQPWSPVDEGAIGAAQVLDQVLLVREGNPRVAAGDFRFRVILVEIDVGKDAAIRVPPSNHQLAVSRERELPSAAAGCLNHQPGLFLPVQSLSIGARRHLPFGCQSVPSTPPLGRAWRASPPSGT